jgi:hypothetical protein
MGYVDPWRFGAGLELPCLSDELVARSAVRAPSWSAPPLPVLGRAVPAEAFHPVGDARVRVLGWS